MATCPVCVRVCVCRAGPTGCAIEFSTVQLRYFPHPPWRWLNAQQLWNASNTVENIWKTCRSEWWLSVFTAERLLSFFKKNTSHNAILIKMSVVTWALLPELCAHTHTHTVSEQITHIWNRRKANLSFDFMYILGANCSVEWGDFHISP